MTVQTISNNYQTQNTMRADFKNFRTDLNTFQSALNSGDQDQVTLSESALSQAITQLQSDFSSVTQGQPAGNGNQVRTAGNGGNMQSFQNDLQTLQSALNPAAQTQGPSSQSSVGNALNQVEGDLAGMKGHGHHHHADADNSAGSATDGETVLSGFLA